MSAKKEPAYEHTVVSTKHSEHVVRLTVPGLLEKIGCPVDVSKVKVILRPDDEADEVMFPNECVLMVLWSEDQPVE